VVPLASIVVPTRNRAEVLRLCLESFVRQTLPPERFQVIVVDNGSTDKTWDVASSFADRLSLTLLYEPEPGLHVGRHAGWRAARSDVLMFCDDDIEADPGWVEAVVRRFADPQVAMVGGNNRPGWQGELPLWLRLWWGCPVGHGSALPALSVLDFGMQAIDIDPGWIWGCNFSVRAAVLKEARGFHPDGVPKERLRWRGDGETHVSDFVRDSGLRAVFDPAASVTHRVDAVRMTPGYFEQRAFAQGVSDSYTAIRRRGALGREFRHWLTPYLNAWRDRGIARSAGAGLSVVQLRSVLHAVRHAYRRGVSFHRAEVRRDPALLAWVLKEDYL
jgi:glycosyltransferase involved in cell wall biosynthesis